ncbi:hypothetical protein AVEN_106804-1 [Araneus ventricosus]|uniref:Uncharacterized protein n=1 Tax=Araneus ventricosus TaxID=182803 RepID=A0A4Y2SHT6_ARAVE|nr:hypothetical protein AVEN_106804-1 [Araneus ventricosus]
MVLIYLAYLRRILAHAYHIWGCSSKTNLTQIQTLENKTLRMIGLLAYLPIHLSHLPDLQLIKDCEPVALQLQPQCPNVLCTCFPADSSPPTTVVRYQAHLFHGNCNSLIVISTSEIYLPHVSHASRHASSGACSPMNCVSL